MPGQALVVFIPKETYQVRSGDTIYGIARQAGISARELIQRNPSRAQGAPLTVGEHLTLRLKEEPEGSLMVNGYAYPHIEQRVLRQAMPYLTDLSLFSYGFREDGALVPLADSRLLAEASLFGAGAVLVLTSIDESGKMCIRDRWWAAGWIVFAGSVQRGRGRAQRNRCFGRFGIGGKSSNRRTFGLCGPGGHRRRVRGAGWPLSGW